MVNPLIDWEGTRNTPAILNSLIDKGKGGGGGKEEEQ